MAEQRFRVRVGCAGLPPRMSRPRYFQRLPYLESPATYYDPPRPATLRRWRREVPDAGFGIQAWQVITHDRPPRGYPRLKRSLPAEQQREGGSFRASALVAAATREVAEAAAALEAEAVVFRSPADFAPSSTNRDRMRRYFNEVGTAETFGGAVRVWEPQGLWEPETAAATAAELGILYACDPLGSDPLGPGHEFFASLPSDEAYFRISGLGRARRIDDWSLEELAEIASGYRRAWIAFGEGAMIGDATRLAKMLAAAEDDDEQP